VVADQAQRLGTAADYAEARLEPTPGATLTATALYQDYFAWCRMVEAVPLRRDPFLREFIRLATEIGLAHREQGHERVFMDVGLVP
jgi:hypothetical protein